MSGKSPERIVCGHSAATLMVTEALDNDLFSAMHAAGAGIVPETSTFRAAPDGEWDGGV